MAIPRSPRLPCLTGARFGAALLVVLFHFGKLPGLPEIFFLFGRQAVSFFFILSGLVLTYSYRDALRAGAIGWTGFMNLRCARILPLHVTTWLMATVLYGWYRWYPDQGSHPLATWLMGLFCVQVYWPSVDNAYKWNGPAWSI